MNPAERLDALVSATPPSELPALASELARALTTVIARAANPTATRPATPVQGGKEEWLTVQEAADRLNVTVEWLYRHARNLSFARKFGRRTLRFEARGLERWAANRPQAARPETWASAFD
jgi:excisionase family DNA binding protein